jgi:hypothetical protein
MPSAGLRPPGAICSEFAIDPLLAPRRISCALAVIQAQDLDSEPPCLSASEMDAGTALAIVAIVASVLMAGVQYRFQTKLALMQHKLDQASKDEERKFTAKAQLDRVREPLLAATVDLAGRLDNIRNMSFLDSYLTSADPHRSAVARSSVVSR